MKRLSHLNRNDQRAQALVRGHGPSTMFAFEDPFVSGGMTMA
jgi:hypothetical protein